MSGVNYSMTFYIGPPITLYIPNRICPDILSIGRTGKRIPNIAWAGTCIPNIGGPGKGIPNTVDGKYFRSDLTHVV